MDVKETALGTASARHVWETVRLKIVRGMMRERLPDFGRPDDALLDIGCGDVYVLESLAGLYPQATFIGVDSALSAEKAAEYSARLPNMRVYQSYGEAPAAISYTAVLLLDVLEHVENDLAMLRGLADGAATRNAVFFITVPAFNALFSSHDRFLGHRRRYTLSQLRETAAGAGLAPLGDGYFFASLLLARLLLVAAERVFPRRQPAKSTVAGWRGGKADKMLATILMADYGIGKKLRGLGTVLPGLSCYAICKKRPS